MGLTGLDVLFSCFASLCLLAAALACRPWSVHHERPLSATTDTRLLCEQNKTRKRLAFPGFRMLMFQEHDELSPSLLAKIRVALPVVLCGACPRA